MTEAQYPIQLVTRLTGLSAHVIRIWEQSYRPIEPQRTATKHWGADVFHPLEPLRPLCGKGPLIVCGVAFGPTVGPVRDLVLHLLKQLAEPGIRLTLIQRASDAHAFALASAGFFPFWEKMSRHLRSADSAAP